MFINVLEMHSLDLAVLAWSGHYTAFHQPRQSEGNFTEN